MAARITDRPSNGLWTPQRKAVAFVLAYLACQQQQPPLIGTLRESALVKMPTGTGKTGVDRHPYMLRSRRSSHDRAHVSAITSRASLGTST